MIPHQFGCMDTEDSETYLATVEIAKLYPGYRSYQTGKSDYNEATVMRIREAASAIVQSSDCLPKCICELVAQFDSVEKLLRQIRSCKSYLDERKERDHAVVKMIQDAADTIRHITGQVPGWVNDMLSDFEVEGVPA